MPKNSKVWGVDRLREVKADHEKVYTGAIDHLRSAVMDVTASQKYTSAKIGELLLGADFTEEKLRINLEHLNRLGERLADLPTGPRSVLVLVLHRGKTSSWPGVNDEVRVDLSILNSYADCAEGELIDHLRALEHANLGYFDVEEFGAYPPMFVAAWSTPEEIGWPIFADLKALDGGDGEIIRRAVLGLDLSVLDS